MVKSLNIGIVGIQGAISEHVNSMKNTIKKHDISGNIFIIKNKFEIESIDALIIPGGESTTISKFLVRFGIYNEIKKRIKKNNLPIMGTCAGCVLLSSELKNETKEINLLKAMNMKVIRNAFGRQKESFENKIKIDQFEEPYNAVFIRAPIIDKVWGKCYIISKINNNIIMARQDKYLALSFHPELTEDLRIHEYFLKMINESLNSLNNFK
jgi:5'-phosphate synthase pdxT subunit